MVIAFARGLSVRGVITRALRISGWKGYCCSKIFPFLTDEKWLNAITQEFRRL